MRGGWVWSEVGLYCRGNYVREWGGGERWEAVGASQGAEGAAMQLAVGEGPLMHGPALGP